LPKYQYVSIFSQRGDSSLIYAQFGIGNDLLKINPVDCS
jgi:hypothetical protein